MASALAAYATAMRAGDLSHDGHPTFARHIGNACRRTLSMTDDTGQPMWSIYKERPDSPHKIDAAVAGCLSWQARTDALAEGAVARRMSVYNDSPLLVLG